MTTSDKRDVVFVVFEDGRLLPCFAEGGVLGLTEHIEREFAHGKLLVVLDARHGKGDEARATPIGVRIDSIFSLVEAEPTQPPTPFPPPPEPPAEYASRKDMN